MPKWCSKTAQAGSGLYQNIPAYPPPLARMECSRALQYSFPAIFRFSHKRNQCCAFRRHRGIDSTWLSSPPANPLSRFFGFCEMRNDVWLCHICFNGSKPDDLTIPILNCVFMSHSRLLTLRRFHWDDYIVYIKPLSSKLCSCATAQYNILEWTTLCNEILYTIYCWDKTSNDDPRSKNRPLWNPWSITWVWFPCGTEWKKKSVGYEWESNSRPVASKTAGSAIAPRDLLCYDFPKQLSQYCL